MGQRHSIGWGKFLVLFLFSVASLASAKDVGDPVLGYTARIPDTWIQFKSSMMAAMQQRLTGGQATNLTFVDGFGTGFSILGAPSYPYALVSKVSYGDVDEISSMSEGELRRMTASISGASPSDVQKQLPPNAAAMIQAGKIQASYITSPPGWRMETVINAQTVGPIHCKSIGYFGKTQAVQFMIYDRESNWSSNVAQYDQILNTFQLDSEHQVPLGAASGLEGITMDSVWMHLIEFVVIGGLFALFIAWKFKKA
jgi:hypothetical protein